MGLLETEADQQGVDRHLYTASERLNTEQAFLSIEEESPAAFAQAVGYVGMQRLALQSVPAACSKVSEGSEGLHTDTSMADVDQIELEVEEASENCNASFESNTASHENPAMVS